MCQSDSPRRMGRPIKTINEIVNGKASITPDTAIQLELTLGIVAASGSTSKPLTERTLRVTRRGGARRCTYRGRTRSRSRTWSTQARQPSRPKADTLGAVRVLRVGSPRRGRANGLRRRLRIAHSPAFAFVTSCSAAWLRWGEIIAERMETEPFDAQRFRKVLAEIRGMTRRDFPLIMLCSGALRERGRCADSHARVWRDPPQRCRALAVARQGDPPAQPPPQVR